MKWLDKYVKAFMLGLQSAMEYRLNFVLNVFSAVFPMLIQYFLWTAVFSSSQNPTVYGYTYPQMIAYTILAGLVSKLVATGFEWEVADDIKNGGLNKYIIKPIGYFQYRISCFLGQKSFQTGIMLIITLIVFMLLTHFLGLETGGLRIALFFASILLALVLNFLIIFCASSSAFWINEAGSVFVIVGLVVNILSGGVFPLDIFGEKVVGILNLLPFKYTIYFPVNIINGKLEVYAILQGLLLQSVWIVIMSFAAKGLWGIGARKYVAVGG